MHIVKSLTWLKLKTTVFKCVIDHKVESIFCWCIVMQRIYLNNFQGPLFTYKEFQSFKLSGNVFQKIIQITSNFSTTSLNLAAIKFKLCNYLLPY